MQSRKLDVGNYLAIFLFISFSVALEASAQQPAPSPDSKGKDAGVSVTSKSGVQAAGRPQTPDFKAPVVTGPDQNIHLNTSDGLDPKTKLPTYKTIVEDWSNLAIGKSELHPEPPLVAQTEDLGAFTRTLVQLKWRPGDPLDLYVILPKDVKNPPAVLYLYGHDEDTDRFKDDRWCARVTGGGVAAIGFVSALTGHRFHDRPLKQWFVSELQESLGSTVHDVKFILDYLASRGDIDMNRIGMFGQGSGGTIAILAAAADSRIKAIDLLDPWGDWPVWLAKSSVVKEDPNKANYVKPAFLKKVAPLDSVLWLPKLKSIHIRLTQPMDADPVPRICKDRIKLALPHTKQVELVRYKTLAEMYNAQGAGYLFQWIKLLVKGLPTTASPAIGVKTAAATDTAQPDEKHSPSQN
jgi:hypothetical protein